MNPREFLPDILAQCSTAPIWAQLLTKATLLLAVAWVVHFSLARANPRWRTLLWRGTLVGLALVAVWTAALPGLEIRIQTPASASATPTPSSQPMPSERDPRVGVPAVAHRAEAPAAVGTGETPPQGPVEARPAAALPTVSSGPWLSWPVALLGMWGFGAALLVVRLAIACVRLARLLRASRAAPEAIVVEVARVAAALGCRRQVEVRTSRQYAVPFQYGLRRPVLVLPERMCQPAYRGQLPGVIAHELAHVASGDFAWNAALQAAAILLWFHPLAWRIGSAHRAACDAVCDAVAASYAGDVQGYCRTLAQVALEGAASFPALGLAMARACDVRRRIAALQRRVRAATLGRQAVAGAALTGLLASSLLAGMSLALAEPPAEVAAATSTISPGTDLYGDPLPAGAIARLGTVRYRLDFSEFQQRIAFAADNTTLISQNSNGDVGGTFCWWDATSGKLLRRVGPENGMGSRECAITPEGKIAVTVVDSARQPHQGASASPQFRLKWWEVATGKELTSLAIPNSNDSLEPRLAIAADGKTTATAEQYGKRVVRIWDVATRKQTAVFTADSPIEDVALSANGKVAVFVTMTKGVFLWELASGQEPRTVLAPSKKCWPWKAAFSTDGKLLAVAGRFGNVVLLEGATGQLARTLDWPHLNPAIVAFSFDGKQLALADAGDKSNKIVVWDLTSGKSCRVFDRLSDWGVNGMAFSPDGRLLAIAANILQVWDLTSGKRISADFVGHEPYVSDAVFLGQSDTVATAGGEGAVRLWEARSGRQKMLIRLGSLVGALAGSPDGKLIASSSWTGVESGSVRLWDADTGKPLREFSGRARMGVALRLGFSADGKRLAGAGNDGKVRIWNTESGALLNENDLQLGATGTNDQGRRKRFEFLLRNAVFAPDVQFLTARYGDTFRVLSAETGNELHSFSRGGLENADMAISADGKLLLSNRRAKSPALNPDGTPQAKPLDPKTHELRLWELPGGKEIWRQELPGDDAGPVAFSTDGKRFAVSVRGPLREIRVCDLATRKVLQMFNSTGHPRCLSFSPDGHLLVAGMEDGSALTWDLSELSGAGRQ